MNVRGRKRCLSVLLLMAGVALGPVTAAAVEITRLGGSTAFVPRPLETAADLQQVCGELRQDLAAVLRLADWPGSVGELCAAIATGISETTVATGTSMRWMALRRGGALDLLYRPTWAGTAPFAAYQLSVEHDNVRYTFVIPKRCGNLALLDAVSELTIAVNSGEINLTGADGRPVRIRPGQPVTITAPHQRPHHPGDGRDTSVSVAEGTVELSTDGHPVTMVLESGNNAKTVPYAGGCVGFEVPPDNPEAVALRIGDLTGTIAPGTSATATWPTEEPPAPTPVPEPTPAPAPEPEPAPESAPAPAPAPPVCALQTSATTVCIDEAISLDTSGSSDSTGMPVQLTLATTGPDGTSEKLGTGAGPTWTYQPTEAGTHTFAVVATTSDGRRSEPCTATVEVSSCLPTCSLGLSPAMVNVGDRLTIDATGSTAQVGQLSRVEVEVLGAAGNTLQTIELTEAPFTARVTTEDHGSYTYRAVAVDRVGRRSENTCQVSLVVMQPENRSGFSLSLLAGGERRWLDDLGETRSTTLYGGKLGFAWALGTSWSLGLATGVAEPSADEADSAWFFDVETSRKLDWGFLGGGIGMWDPGDSGSVTADLLLSAGLDLPLSLADRPFQLMVEGRILLDNHTGDNTILWGGLRIPLW